MDQIFDKLILCLEKIKVQLRSISRKRSEKPKIKKRRISPGAERKFLAYENNMKHLRRELVILYGELFEERNRLKPGVCSQIAREILRVMVSTSIDYEVSDEALFLAIQCLVAPIISQIMNVMENNRDSELKQKLRQQFIMKLLTIPLPATGESSQHKPADEPVDVTNLEDDRDAEKITTSHCSFGVTIVTSHILSSLFNAIDKHIANCEQMKSDHSFVRMYYHNIMNVFRLTKVLRKYFEQLRIQMIGDDINKFKHICNVQLVQKCIPSYLERVNSYLDRMVNVTQFELMRMELSRISYTLVQLKEEEK